MSDYIGSCEHRWRYFVNVESRAVRVRQCERCRARVVLTAGEPVVSLETPAEKLPA